MSKDEKKEKTTNSIDFKSYLNVYNFDTELPGSREKVTFRPITTGQLKQMLIYENETNPIMIEEALDNLIETSVISPDFDINKLYLQDRFFLLVQLRRRSKGDNYEFAYKCNKCGIETRQIINLSKLNVIILEDVDGIVRLDEKISLELQHITRGAQKQAYKNIKKIKSMSDTQRMTEMTLYSHAASIKTIIVPEGNIIDSSIEDRKFLLENIPTGSYDKIKNWFNDNDFGIDFTYKVGCAECNQEEEISIPTDNFFF